MPSLQTGRHENLALLRAGKQIGNEATPFLYRKAEFIISCHSFDWTPRREILELVFKGF